MFSQFRMCTSCAVQPRRLFLINSGQEREIIEHPSSCYLIGRSGTGKTTTMLFKMLAIQRTWERYPDMGLKPRQVFVTQSRFLATMAEGCFSKLMSSIEDAGYSSKELRKRVKDSEQEVELVDVDDNGRWSSDVPERFSELADEHFPLFITYDRVRIFLCSKHLISPFREQLCTMLQNDIRRGNRNHGLIIPGTNLLGDEAIFRGNFVSYGEFLASYWDHLPQTMTRALGKE